MMMSFISLGFVGVLWAVIGYSLALQVSLLMSAALSESFIPVANRSWETGGADAVRALKAKVDAGGGAA